MNDSVALVVATLKKKNKVSLANQILEALGIDFDVNTDITNNEIEQEIKQIKQYIPTEASVDIALAESNKESCEEKNLELIADLFINEDNVTTASLEKTAETNDVPVSDLIDKLCEITKAFWVSEAQVDESNGQEIVYNEEHDKQLISIDKVIANDDSIEYSLISNEKPVDLIKNVNKNNEEIETFEDEIIKGLKMKFEKYKKILTPVSR
jgi:hypothetical protein